MLSTRLIELRNKKGITQTELAKILNIRQNTYSQYETKNRQPDYETLKKIADYYQVSIDYLLEHEKKQNKLIEIINMLNEEQKEKLLNVCKAIYPEEYRKVEK
jgi:transcriptional regulator with XRE-family HTH domain